MLKKLFGSGSNKDSSRKIERRGYNPMPHNWQRPPAPPAAPRPRNQSPQSERAGRNTQQDQRQSYRKGRFETYAIDLTAD